MKYSCVPLWVMTSVPTCYQNRLPSEETRVHLDTNVHDPKKVLSCSSYSTQQEELQKCAEWYWESRPARERLSSASVSRIHREKKTNKQTNHSSTDLHCQRWRGKAREMAEVSESDSTEFSVSSRLVTYSLEKARGQGLRKRSWVCSLALGCTHTCP